jgi:hypothetical protein
MNPHDYMTPDEAEGWFKADCDFRRGDLCENWREIEERYPELRDSQVQDYLDHAYKLLVTLEFVIAHKSALAAEEPEEPEPTDEYRLSDEGRSGGYGESYGERNT